jgi:hypothetical protein
LVKLLKWLSGLLLLLLLLLLGGQLLRSRSLQLAF